MLNRSASNRGFSKLDSRNLIILVLGIISISIIIIWSNSIIQLIFIAVGFFLLAVWLMISRPPTWILLCVFTLPFVFYLRQFFPYIVNIGGNNLVLTGITKELLSISVLVVAIPHLKRKMPKSYFPASLILYMVICFFGALRSLSIVEFLAYLRVYWIGIIFFIVAPLLARPIWVKRLALLLIGLAIIDSALGLYRFYVDPTFLILNPEIIHPTYLAYEGSIYRLNGIGQVNVSGVLMAIGIFSLLFFRRKDWFINKTWWILFGLFIYTLFLTQSRTGFIAFLAGMIIWLLSGVAEKKFFRKFAISVVVIFGAITIITLISNYYGSTAIDRIIDIRLDPNEGRGLVWRQLISRMSGWDYIFGKGLNVIGGLGLGYSASSLGTTADNFFLNLLLSIGSFGLITFVFFSITILVRGLRMIIREKQQNEDGALFSMNYLLGIVFICLLVSAAGISIQEPFFGAIFWLGSGIINFLYLKNKKKIPRKKLPDKNPSFLLS